MEENFVTSEDVNDDFKACAREIAAGKTGHAWVKEGSSKRLVAYRGIKGTNWGFAISIDESEILALTNKLSLRITLGGVSSVILMLVVAGILLRTSL